jgi:hypothetical protein
MTDEREVTERVEAWKRAARHTRRLHLGTKAIRRSRGAACQTVAEVS